MIRHRAFFFVLAGAALAALAGAGTAAAAFPGGSVAQGLSVNVPVVGRLVGSGGILFKTAIDVSNNTGTAAQIDYYLVGTAGATSISVTGSISSSGTLVPQGTGGAAHAHTNFHSDDFIDSLVQADAIPASVESANFVGSVRFVFDGFTKSGQGSASANFYRQLSAGGVSGTIGVSAAGHEITANEPMAIVGTFRGTVGKPGPQVYSNLFVNNMGVTPVAVAPPCTSCPQSALPTAIDVKISAFSGKTGSPVGKAKAVTGIGPGQTVAFGPVLSALEVPASEDTVIVYVTVTSGNAAIQGLAVQIDNGTHDSSSVDMRRADF